MPDKVLHEGDPNSYTGRTQADLITQINLDIVGRSSDPEWGDPDTPVSHTDRHWHRSEWEDLFAKINSVRHSSPEKLFWRNFQHIWCYNYNDILDLTPEDFYSLGHDLRQHKLTTPVITLGKNISEYVDAIISNWNGISTVIIKTPVIKPDTWCKHYGKSELAYSVWLHEIADLGDQIANYNRTHGSTSMPIHIWITGIDRFTTDHTEQELIHPDDIIPDWHSELSYATKLKHDGILKSWQIGGLELRNHCNHSKILQVTARPRHRCGRTESWQGLFAGHTDIAEFGIRNKNILNIANNGDCYVCTEDLSQRFVYGNVFAESLTDIWRSDLRQQCIREMMETVCQSCQYAI